MSAPDRFDVLGADEALGPFEPTWRALLEASASDTVFLTPEWLRAWWSAYGRPREAAVVVARRGGEAVAILPLQIAAERFRGLVPIRSLRFLGDGTNDSDYLDFIVPRGEESSILPAFWGWLQNGGGPLRYDLARLNEMPVSSPPYAIVRALAEGDGTFLEEERIGCVAAALPESWPAYLASLKPRMRTKVRSLRRELEASHAVALERCDSEDTFAERLDSLMRLHERRWSTRGKPGVFGSPEKRGFYQALGRTLQARGWLELYSLRVDGALVAHEFCVGYKGTVYLLQEGYDPSWEGMGVGNVLRAMLFERLIGAGWRSYDFLGGVTSHKLSWGGAVTESARLTLRGSGARGALVAGLTRLAAFSAPIRARLRRTA